MTSARVPVSNTQHSPMALTLMWLKPLSTKGRKHFPVKLSVFHGSKDPQVQSLLSDMEVERLSFRLHTPPLSILLSYPSGSLGNYSALVYYTIIQKSMLKVGLKEGGVEAGGRGGEE